MMSVALISKETQGTQTEIPLLPHTLLRHIVSDVLYIIEAEAMYGWS
jgi:hypothetical protein